MIMCQLLLVTLSRKLYFCGDELPKVCQLLLVTLSHVGDKLNMFCDACQLLLVTLSQENGMRNFKIEVVECQLLLVTLSPLIITCC